MIKIYNTLIRRLSCYRIDVFALRDDLVSLYLFQQSGQADPDRDHRWNGHPGSRKLGDRLADCASMWAKSILRGIFPTLCQYATSISDSLDKPRGILPLHVGRRPNRWLSRLSVAKCPNDNRICARR
jgi:hypothetical protein